MIVVTGSDPSLRERIIEKLVQRFYDVQSLTLFKCVLWILGEYPCRSHAASALDQIQRAIGSLPIAPEKQSEEKDQTKADAPKKQKTKTVVLADGTYGTQLVDDDNDGNDYSRRRRGAGKALINNLPIGSRFGGMSWSSKETFFFKNIKIHILLLFY